MLFYNQSTQEMVAGELEVIQLWSVCQACARLNAQFAAPKKERKRKHWLDIALTMLYGSWNTAPPVKGLPCKCDDQSWSPCIRTQGSQSMPSCNPNTEETKEGRFLLLLASQSRWISKLQVQCQVLSQKIRERGTEENTKGKLPVSIHTCAYVHMYHHPCTHICERTREHIKITMMTIIEK